MEAFSLLEIIGSLVGLLYVYLEYRASVWLWAVGIVMPAIYIFIYHQAGIFADMGINIYYLVAGVYGWCVWLGRSRSAKGSDGAVEQPIVHTSKGEWWRISTIFAVLMVLLSYVLINFTTSTVPYCDSFTTALSVVAMWMLAHKRVEHWILWIAIDAVSAVLYVYKGLYPTAALYALYTVIAVGGYVKWLKMMKSETSVTSK